MKIVSYFADQMFKVLKTIVSFTGWFLTCLIFTLICIPLTFLPAPYRYTNRLYFFITTIWCHILMFFSFLRVSIRGRENLPKYPAIFVINHSSSIDIFLIEKIIGTYPHTWISKYSYTKIPLFSILLKRMHIPLERDKSASAAKVFLKAYHRGKSTNSHLLIFPEGTRYDDGLTHPFHEGFALLAKKLNRPVIPIKITGLHKIFPKGKFLINYHAANPTLTIGKPMVIQGHETIEEFTLRVQTWFAKSQT